MGKRLYRFCRVLVRIFTKPMRTEWAEQPDDGPYVFAVNHDGAHGPLLMCAHFPLRDQCHPWINSPVYDREAMPEYVLHDFWWKPGCFWEPVLKRTVPYIAAALVPPLMEGADGIPIYRDQRVMTTFRENSRSRSNSHSDPHSDADSDTVADAHTDARSDAGQHGFRVQISQQVR